MKKPNGVILFEGQSALDNSPIVVIATLNSKNVKTGNMVQTWILRSDVAPMAALDSKDDASICGVCPHRRSLGGSCYVDVARAPSAVYKAYKRGIYPVLSDNRDLEKYLKGRMIRFGAYGDPAAAPVQVWRHLHGLAAGHTGYTHQMSHKKFDPSILNYCMASADTPKSAKALHEKGHRTFRVKTEAGQLLPGEVVCLSDSAGISCHDCGLCDGALKGAASVVIDIHGSLAGRYTKKYGNANLIAATAI